MSSRRWARNKNSEFFTIPYNLRTQNYGNNIFSLSVYCVSMPPNIFIARIICKMDLSFNRNDRKLSIDLDAWSFVHILFIWVIRIFISSIDSRVCIAKNTGCLLCYRFNLKPFKKKNVFFLSFNYRSVNIVFFISQSEQLLYWMYISNGKLYCNKMLLLILKCSKKK